MENEMVRTRKRPDPKGCFTIRKHKIMCRECKEPDCGLAELLEADTSAFHTDQIAEATRAINKILSGIPPDSEGRILSFIQTKMGIMLGWVEHEADGTCFIADKHEDDITSADDNESLAKALNLKNYNLEAIAIEQ